MYKTHKIKTNSQLNLSVETKSKLFLGHFELWRGISFAVFYH